MGRWALAWSQAPAYLVQCAAQRQAPGGQFLWLPLLLLCINWGLGLLAATPGQLLLLVSC